MDWLASIGLLLTGFGLVGTAIALYQTRKQAEQAQKVTLGQFLLDLDEKFSHHQDAHVALRPGGKSANEDAGPVTAEEWAQVEAYMGLFERINILIDKNILDADTVDRLYGYRVNNIVANPVINQAKLVKKSEDWTNFLSLCEKLNIQL